VAVTREFHGQVVSLEVPLRVREVSREGFSVESDVAFPIGSEELFRFSSASHRRIDLRARCVHIEPSITDGAQPRFLAGFEVLTSFKPDLGTLVEWLERRGARRAEGSEPFFRGPATPIPPGSSRRSSPRFEATGTIEVAIGDPAVQVRLRDIGLGGFAVESRTPFAPRQRYPVRFTSPHGLDARLTAEAVHARHVEQTGERFWLTGFAYIVDSSSAHDAVESVLDQATSSLSFL
jgi:hypothetical protein